MDGITVLNEIVETIEPLSIWVWALMLGLAIILTLILICGLFWSVKKKNIDCIVLLSFYSLLAVFVWISVCCGYKETQREPYTIIQYEVTLSSDVSLIEFNEKYEIIEQRGQIYVIQERESNE